MLRQFGIDTSLWNGGRKCSYVLCWSNSLHYTLNLENRCAPDIPNRTRRPLLIVISYFLRLHRQGEITSAAPIPHCSQFRPQLPNSHILFLPNRLRSQTQLYVNHVRDQPQLCASRARGLHHLRASGHHCLAIMTSRKS